jgi:hypothetical protein
MKSKIITTSRVSILALAVVSFSFAGLAMAQNPLSGKDKTFMKKAAKGGMNGSSDGKISRAEWPKRRCEIIRQTNGR